MAASAAYRTCSWIEQGLIPAVLRPASERPAADDGVCNGQELVAWLRVIVQPDVTKVGGLSEQRRIGWTAYDKGIRLIPRGWNTAVGLAADLQLASALPDRDLVEYIAESAYVDYLTVDGWELDDDGMLPFPDRLGLGVRIDPERLGRYTGADRQAGDLLADRR
jgi:L-alanine-DL-glutamate epimerase-like enolase superfamily enzyme